MEDKTARLVFLDRISIFGKAYTFRMDKKKLLSMAPAGSLEGIWSQTCCGKDAPTFGQWTLSRYRENLSLDLRPNDSRKAGVIIKVRGEK